MSAHSVEEHAALAAGWQDQALHALFNDSRLPARPRCSNDPQRYGTRVLPLILAAGHRYIQYNRPGKTTYLVFDLDYAGAAYAWVDAGLPAPTWTCTNPGNGHAHLGYALKDPVVTCSAGHQAPARYLGAIEAAFGDALKADVDFNRGLTKNPLHSHWLTEVIRLEPYTLQELAEYVDLKGRTRARLIIDGKRGRNCELFDAVRKWSYREVLAFRLAGSSLEEWLAHVERETTERNAFADAYPLPARETRHLAKSIAVWTWRHYTGCGTAEPEFRAAQARRGKAKGATKRALGLDMLANGRQVAEIMSELGVCEKTVYNWASARRATISDSNARTAVSEQSGLGRGVSVNGAYVQSDS